MRNNYDLTQSQLKVYGKDVIYYDITDSTNTRAIELLKSRPLPEGTALRAGAQTKGRGTQGKNWESSTPQGLWTSIILYEPIKTHPLSFVPAIASVKLLNEKYNIEAHVKWPNDILVGSKKIGGILCESVATEKYKAWVIGVGLNVTQQEFATELSDKAISMFQITHLNYDIEVIFRDFVEEFQRTYETSINVVNLWKQYTRMIGRKIDVIKNGQFSHVEVIDVSQNGFLVVRLESGKVEEWASASNLDIAPTY